MKTSTANTILCIGFLAFSHVLYGQNNQLPTSFTDGHEYKEFCFSAAQQSSVFAEFRSDPICQDVLEHVSFQQGQQYLEIIKKQTPHLLDCMNRFKTSELVGSPAVCFYPGVGVIAPTTLRYIKVASDLEIMFGSLKDMSIIEIGGGYGGLCKILADLGSFKKYTIVDLEGPLALTKQFLAQFNIQNVELITPENYVPGQEFDLVISNYAFSECTRGVQKKYIDEIMKYSKNGYLTCNVLPNRCIDIPSQQDVLHALGQAKISYRVLPEEPLTGWNNYLVIWYNNVQFLPQIYLP